MRLFLVAAAFCSISQLALAFDYDQCKKIKSSSLFWYESSIETQDMAMKAVEGGYSKADDSAKKAFGEWSRRADDQVKKSSVYANIYQAFCKD